MPIVPTWDEILNIGNDDPIAKSYFHKIALDSAARGLDEDALDWHKINRRLWAVKENHAHGKSLDVLQSKMSKDSMELIELYGIKIMNFAKEKKFEELHDNLSYLIKFYLFEKGMNTQENVIAMKNHIVQLVVDVGHLLEDSMIQMVPFNDYNDILSSYRALKHIYIKTQSEMHVNLQEIWTHTLYSLTDSILDKGIKAAAVGNMELAQEYFNFKQLILNEELKDLGPAEYSMHILTKINKDGQVILDEARLYIKDTLKAIEDGKSVFAELYLANSQRLLTLSKIGASESFLDLIELEEYWNLRDIVSNADYYIKLMEQSVPVKDLKSIDKYFSKAIKVLEISTELTKSPQDADLVRSKWNQVLQQFINILGPQIKLSQHYKNAVDRLEEKLGPSIKSNTVPFNRASSKKFQ